MNYKQGQRYIVCAANISSDEEVMLIGARHWDGLMHQQADMHPDKNFPIHGQGFIDQYGKWHSRQDAWKIAEEAGQIRRRCGGDDSDGGTLCSENLY